MNDVVDLELAVHEIERRTDAWLNAGVSVGSVTWREQGEGWPPTLKTDRRDVRDADSIGVHLRKGVQEGEVVLFKGGWCDFSFWSGYPADDVEQDAPGYPDEKTVTSFGEVLDRLAGCFK